MSVAMHLEISSTSASQNQLTFAAELGIDTEADSNAESLIRQIERQLGQDTILEQSRWYVMSVLRHLKHADWSDPLDSNLETDRQYALAQDNIATDALKKSLQTILKDYRCKFTLVDFGKSRNGRKRILSYTTKAFSRASLLLTEAGLVEARKKNQPQTDSMENSSAVPTTNSVVSRRAARRGYSGPSSATEIEVEQSAQKPIDSTTVQEMSEEEYAELDKAFEDGDQQPMQNWHYKSYEDRISLALGVVAGFGVCAIVLWVFL